MDNNWVKNINTNTKLICICDFIDHKYGSNFKKGMIYNISDIINDGVNESISIYDIDNHWYRFGTNIKKELYCSYFYDYFRVSRKDKIKKILNGK